MAGGNGGPATLKASFVPKHFRRLKREEEAKIPLLSCTESLSYKRLNKYPGQFRQNFVNPLKACKIWVECGYFPLRHLWWCCSGEVRVGCCFPRWVWCIPLVLVELPRAPQTPTENVSCEVQAVPEQGWHTELVPVLQPNPAGQAASEHGERAVWNQVKTSGTNSTDKVFKSPPLSYCLGILGNTQLYSFLFLSENQTMILVSHFKVDFESLVSSIPLHFSVSYVLF